MTIAGCFAGGGGMPVPEVADGGLPEPLPLPLGGLMLPLPP